ncbi:galactokinase [Pontibacter qinzhouensis]|uniref:Galactokinase n=1 Tax=Pontibacter qinzhouensis TaxID=2603253 RepID=A0A5C8KAQ8_9BACT|nr:galactokinase [Pontibacter qinzhouensis]TXK52166.1 galactokinase [Pontibacter qinzhouensis]
MIDQIKDKFFSLYQQEPLLFRSPGRVNLIGEHTDYNEGFVLPAAINKEIYFAVAPNGTQAFRAYSYDMDESATFDLTEVQPSQLGWANYLLGVVAQFQKAGHHIPGFDLVFGGNIPIGAGLSSSAAVECGLAFALNQIYGLGVEKFDLVKMAQKAEHEYAGVMCGIMDQFASMFGKSGHVVKLDCRSLEYEYFTSDLDEYRIVLLDTQVKHSLASSEYNTRRQECEAGVALLRQHYPQVNSLRDVTVEMLEKHEQEFEPVTYKRCLYVVQENNRVLEACQDLAQGNLKGFGEKMYASHEGLQHQYEVSCPELDFLVEQARKNQAVLGARMMGGGFGGCTINIVHANKIEEYTQQASTAYQEHFGREPKVYVAQIVDGSSQIS